MFLHGSEKRSCVKTLGAQGSPDTQCQVSRAQSWMKTLNTKRPTPRTRKVTQSVQGGVRRWILGCKSLCIWCSGGRAGNKSRFCFILHVSGYVVNNSRGPGLSGEPHLGKIKPITVFCEGSHVNTALPTRNSCQSLLSVAPHAMWPLWGSMWLPALSELLTTEGIWGWTSRLYNRQSLGKAQWSPWKLP